MRKSQAFAAYRTELVADAQLQIQQELIPQFNSEVEDIRRTTEEMKASRGEALADHHKRARINDLKLRQQQFIAGLNQEMCEALEKRVKEYGGQITEVEVEGKTKLEAKFDDNSVARMPKSLWVDYNQFHRV